MEYLDQILTISPGYLITLLILAVFFVLYLYAPYYKHQTGIWPRVSARISSFGNSFVSGLLTLQFMIFGSGIGAPKDFFANEEEFIEAAHSAIRWWTAIVIVSFFVSYEATRELATWIGFKGYVPYVLPFIIDVTIWACIKTIGAYARTGESNQLAQAGVAIYTLLSVVLNVAHLTWYQGYSILIIIGGIAAPLGIWLCSHLIHMLTHKMTYRSGAQRTDDELRQIVEKHQEEVGSLDTDYDGKRQAIKDMEAKLEELEQQEIHMEQLIAKLDGQFFDTVGESGQSRLTKVASLAEAGLSREDIALEMGVQLATIRTYLRQAERDGLLVANGYGGE